MKILIANRGEIAVRIMRACREMGLPSVAVYSDCDRDARHVREADQAFHIGPSEASQSYLRIDRLVDVARRAGADAVHPGYGFLAENAAFARACQDAGLTFVGPTADVIALMGSKTAARAAAIRAGVPVVPGTERPLDDAVGESEIAAIADRVGYPLLVKAVAGGGGKGMRAVEDPASLASAVRTARSEAGSAFGDTAIYIERRIRRPRHIEIQLLGDHHGTVVPFVERECSIQRRHQKVVEETPSTAVTPALRRRMGDAAVAVARAAGYRNAGTVEFLLAGAGDGAPFYYLEMNTRLQVEHPITEQVTGVDLVRAQILVAAGEPLPWTQEALSQRGHAIEVRIYAEDPERGDLPQAGPLLLYRQPSMPGIRIDSGFTEGDVVSVHYDPLLAKLIASGETRELARGRALTALRSFPILGIRTNTALLIELLEHSRFISGDLDTQFLDTEGDSLKARLATEPSPEIVAVAAAVGPAKAGHYEGEKDPWVTLRGLRV